MSTTFTWLSFSEKERRRALDIISQFREQETRDELGIGSVRDAYAEILFPGTGTVQTRAKYFLFIPWIYLALERKQVKGVDFESRARRAEIALIESLRKSGDRAGLIGVDARASLKRLPSEIYWSGLRTWGIRLFPGARYQYFRYIDRFYEHQRCGQADGDDQESGSAVRGNWHSGLPEPDPGFPTNAEFALSRDQAVYLKEQVMLRAPNSMLAFLVDRGKPVGEEVRFPWEHPQYAEMGDVIQSELGHARRFSDAMYGATMLYNLMLAEKRREGEWRESYREELDGWRDDISKRRREFRAWDMTALWHIAGKSGIVIPRLAKLFTESWVTLAIQSGLSETNWEQRARQMVHDRERQVKGAAARLDDSRKLERWSGASAAFRINYRWPQARRITNDILAGLGR